MLCGVARSSDAPLARHGHQRTTQGAIVWAGMRAANSLCPPPPSVAHPQNIGATNDAATRQAGHAAFLSRASRLHARFLARITSRFSARYCSFRNRFFSRMLGRLLYLVLNR
jgi:hypothetical protein